MGDNGNLDKGYKDGSNHETCWRDNDNSKRVKMIWFLQIERDVQKKSRRRGKIAQCDWHMMTDSEEWRLLIWELSLSLPPCYYTMKRKKNRHILLPFVRINQNNSFHLCLSSPSQIFFPLYQTQICFQQWISSYQQFFFLGIAVHTQGLPYTLVKVWVAFFLSGPIHISKCVTFELIVVCLDCWPTCGRIFWFKDTLKSAAFVLKSKVMSRKLMQQIFLVWAGAPKI